jgi:hypothetical protein
VIAGGSALGAKVASASDNPWRSRLYALRGEPLPFFLFEDASLPAASLWSGARLVQKEEWVEPDSSVAVVLPGIPSPRWLQLAVAALFRGRPLCVAAIEGVRVESSRVPHGAVLTLDAIGAEGLVPFDAVFALADRPAPEPIQLEGGGWHEPGRLARVLASLLQRRHVVCAG